MDTGSLLYTYHYGRGQRNKIKITIRVVLPPPYPITVNKQIRKITETKTTLIFFCRDRVTNKKAMLREHKPPPIWMIRISDFGLPDPKRDPDRHQNCITWSLSHALPLQKFRQNPFTSLRVIRQTDRQTNRQTDKQTEPKT